MAEPQQYKKKLAELVPERGSFQPTTVQEAQKAIASIEKIEAFLSTFNDQLIVEIERVEKKFRQAKKEANGAFIDTVLDSDNEKAFQLRLLDEKCKEQIAQYEEIKSIGHKLLATYQTTRKRLQGFIEHEMGQKPSRYTGSLGGLLTGIKSTKDVNYQKYIKSKEWKQKAEEAKTRAGNRCQGCNRPRSEVQLEAHHRTYERIGRERPGDITVLCRDCHQSIEKSKAKVSLAQKMADPEFGVCLRCGTQIPFDTHKPLCKSCFAAWNRFKNFNYEEKHCHACGQTAETSMARPFCFDCYKKVRMIKSP